jgi:hypothetical protein
VEREKNDDTAVSMTEISIRAPEWSEYKRVSVAEFGARSEEGYCNGNAFQNAIDYCKRERSSELVVPSGIYRFYDGNHPIFEGMLDFQFDGGGSEFIFSTVEAFFTIKDCVRTLFKNFTVDWDWESGQLASIGQVRDVAADNSYFDLHFPEYAQVPGDLNIRTLNAMNPLTLSAGCEFGREFHADHFRNVIRQDLNTFRIALSNPEDFRFLNPGQAYIVRHYVYDANALELKSNQHLQIEHVTIYSAPGHAFVASGDQRHWALRNCRIVKRPGTTRCISVTADGCHISNSLGYFIIENCDFSYNGDDCLNIHDNSVQGFKRVDDRTVSLIRVLAWRNPFAIGDAIEFRNEDLSPARFTKRIAGVEWNKEHNACTLTFEQSIPAEISENAILFNRRYDSGNYIVRHNYFHHNRARGILLHSGNGLVENNHFFMNQGSAIQIECGSESRWSEGFGVSNLRIRNNLIDSCDVNHWNMAVIYMGVYLASGRTQYAIFDRIWIESNTIINCPQQAVYASSCSRVYIRHNAILNSNTGRLKSNEDRDENGVLHPECYQGSLMASHCNEVWIENNRRLSTVATTEDRIYIDDATSTNVHLLHNIGFNQDGSRYRLQKKTGER